MLPRLFAIPALLTLAVLGGCGSSPAPTTPPATYLAISGNWEFITSAPLLSLPVSNFTGALQSSGGTVTGTLHALDLINFMSPCVTLNQDLPATGTLDTSGNLTLNVAISGGTAVIKSVLTSNLQFPATGSYVITGGACAQASATSLANQFLPITGTYTGTLTVSGTSSTTAATAVLTQSTTPNADGLFPLSGTIMLAGPACNTTFSFTGGTVTGNAVNLFHTAAYQSPDGDFNGASLPDGSALVSAAISTFTGTGCSFVQGPLKRQ
jgi:hypothetical protein